MFEIVVRRIVDNRPKADWQGEETLRNSGIPDGGLPQSVPFRRYEEEDAVDSTLKSDSSDQQSRHYNVRKYRKEIGGFARALHTAEEHSEDTSPTEEQAYRQFPGRHADTVLDGLVFL